MTTGETTLPAAFTTRKRLAAVLALSVALSPVLGGMAEARLGGGGSFGSRGSRTFSMPSATPTAPRVSPLGRSQAPIGGGFNSFGFRPGLFGGGLGRGLLGGFLGAGLFGLLFGHGFLGGLGGGFSLIGLLLQVGLIYLLFRFVMGRFRGQPAFGGGGLASAFSGGGMGASRPQGAQTQPISIGPDDYQAFEQRLIESQAAYSDRNLEALRRIATPEMVQNFSAELEGNARQGIVNRLSDVRLIQGDLSEAWRENTSEYATVAMRFSLVDAMVEERSGRIVAGNASSAQQVTEAWTFMRPAGSSASGWRLSAIQQA